VPEPSIMPAVPAAEDEGVLAEGQEIVAIPFAKSVLSIFMPGMALAGLLYMLEQQDYAYVIAMANIGFVLYLYSQRLGAAGQMGWKKGVSFNLRNMLEAPKNLLIQERGVEAIRQLVVHKGKADRVAERGGVSILLNILKRHPTQSSLISNVLNTIRAISDAAPLSRRRIFQAIEMKTELSLRMPSSGSDWLNDEDEYVTSSKAILRSFLTVLGSLLDGNSVSLKQLVRSSGVYESVLTLLDRLGMVDTQTVYFGLWSLYQAQHVSIFLVCFPVYRICQLTRSVACRRNVTKQKCSWLSTIFFPLHWTVCVPIVPIQKLTRWGSW
jgi:hypothetical protein